MAEDGRFIVMPIACVLVTDKEFLVSRPLPQSLIGWFAIGGRLNPHRKKSLRAFLLLPSAFFTLLKIAKVSVFDCFQLF